jgi:hypothetical protein
VTASADTASVPCSGISGKKQATLQRDALDGFPRFCAELRARLEAGRRHYADQSFDRPLPELAQEIREELLDVAGWAFIAAVRLERLEEAAQRTEDTSRPPAGGKRRP